MKHFFKLLTLSCILLSTSLAAQEKAQKIGVVNFKTCVENSKIGKKEQANFEALKTGMEEKFLQKDKELNEIAAKLNDSDYLDSLSKEAEAELKHKFRLMTQELTQKQNEFYQTLNQANFSIMQKINAEIKKSADAVAHRENLDLILNEESTFYVNRSLDVSEKIIKEMDSTFVTK